MTALRYVDLVLLWLSVPLALVLGAPAFGVLIAAVAWTIQRIAALKMDDRARGRDARQAIGLNMVTMIVRMWLVAATVVVAGIAGEREDGVAAAVVLLITFTVSFAATLLNRSLTRPGPRTGTPTHA
jgi:L-asparagine transporter-like permease